MSILPENSTKHTRVNPRRMVIFGHTKQGKTVAAANLKNNIIIDLESGADYYDCLRLNIQELALDKKATTWDVIKQVVTELKEYREKVGKNKYKYITIDTGGHLEDVIMPYALQLYKNSPQGKGFKGVPNDLKALPHGAGWGPIREAYFNTLTMFNLYCDTLIVIAHTKLKTVKRKSEEVDIQDIDVSGRMSQMLAGTADAIGLIYRKKNQTILNFKTEENTAAGARNEHLREKEFVLCESDESGNLEFHWDKIFI